LTQDKILNAALALAKKHGYRGVLKRHIAERLGCATGTINYYFGAMDVLRAEMVAEAKRRGVHEQILKAGVPR